MCSIQQNQLDYFHIEGKINFRLFCCSSMRQNSVIEHHFGNDKHSVLMLNTSIPKNVFDMYLLALSFSNYFSFFTAIGVSIIRSFLLTFLTSLG